MVAFGSCSEMRSAIAAADTTGHEVASVEALAVLAGALEDLAAEAALVAVSAVDLVEATLAVVAPAEDGNYEENFKRSRIAELGMAEAF